MTDLDGIVAYKLCLTGFGSASGL